MILIGCDYARVDGGVWRLYCGVFFAQLLTAGCHQPTISNRLLRDVSGIMYWSVQYIVGLTESRKNQTLDRILIFDGRHEIVILSGRLFAVIWPYWQQDQHSGFIFTAIIE